MKGEVLVSITENLKKGTAELLLLTLLKEADMYGYQLTQELEARSEGLFVLREGSMYPTLYRLVDKGMISDRQVKVGQRRVRVYYHIEPKGLEYLEKIRSEYFSINKGIVNILRNSEGATQDE